MEKELKLILKKIIAYVYLFAGYLTIYCFVCMPVFENIRFMDLLGCFIHFVLPLILLISTYAIINHLLIAQIIKVKIIFLFEAVLFFSLIIMAFCANTIN